MVIRPVIRRVLKASERWSVGADIGGTDTCTKAKFLVVETNGNRGTKEQKETAKNAVSFVRLPLNSYYEIYPAFSVKHLFRYLNH